MKNAEQYKLIKKVGQAIQEKRKVLGIDQKTLAELAGVSLHTISNIESGKGNPTIAVLDKLSFVLGLDLIKD